MEQRANVKFCYKLGKTATETREMLLQVYGREAVSRKRIHEWFKHFREGKETTEDESRSGQLLISKILEMIEKVQQMLAQDRRLTLRLISEELGLARTRRTPSSAMIWVSRRPAPELCRTSSQRSRKQDGWKLLETSFPCVTRIHCFWKTSSREIWDLELPVRSGMETAIDGVVFTELPAIKKELSA